MKFSVSGVSWLEYFDAAAERWGGGLLLPSWVQGLLEGGLLLAKWLEGCGVAIWAGPGVLRAADPAVAKDSLCHKNAAKKKCCKQAENQDFHQGYKKYDAEQQREKEFCKSHGVFVFIVNGIVGKTDQGRNYFKRGVIFSNIGAAHAECTKRKWPRQLS